MGVVFVEHVSNDTGTLPVRPVRREAELLHRVENASLHRLQPVTGIGRVCPTITLMAYSR